MEKYYKDLGWDYELISDVLFFQEGPGVRKTQYTTSGVKLLNVTNILDGQLDLSLTDRYISEEEAYGKYNHFLVDPGDLIIACSGIQISYFDKKIAFVDESNLPLCMNTSTMRFKVLNKDKLDIKYVFYFLKSNFFKSQLSKQITGSAQLNFGPSHIKKMHIPIPNINNQRKITRVLDKITELIKIRQDQVQALDDLIDSSFDEINEKSDKKSISFDDIFTFIDGDRGKNYPKKNDLLSEGYCLFLNAKNVTTRGFKFDNLEFISQERDKLLRKGRVEKGDLILTTRGTVGNIAFYSDDVPYDKIRINSGMVILRRKQDINPLYFQQLIRKTHVLKSAMSGSAQPQLPIKNLKNVKIPIIPIEKQNKFADLVTKIEGQKGILEDSLSELSDLFASLMQDAFDGSLSK